MNLPEHHFSTANSRKRAASATISSGRMQGFVKPSSRQTASPYRFQYPQRRAGGVL